MNDNNPTPVSSLRGVTRYDLVDFDMHGGSKIMEPTVDGDWVKWEDIAPHDQNPTPVSSLSGASDLANAAAQVLEWWHEWADHEPEEEEAAAFKALEEALTATGFEYDGQ